MQSSSSAAATMVAGNGGAEYGKAATVAGNGGDDGGKAAMAAWSGGGGGNGGDDGGKATMVAGNGGDDGGKATMVNCREINTAEMHSINALNVAPGRSAQDLFWTCLASAPGTQKRPQKSPKESKDIQNRFKTFSKVKKDTKLERHGFSEPRSGPENTRNERFSIS